MVIRRSPWLIAAESALSRVVLPEPVPPEITVETRALHRAMQEVGDAPGHGPELDQLLQRQRLLGELPDRDRRAVDGDRGDGGVHPAAVGQAGVDHRLALVDPAADAGDDAVDDAQQVVVVAEADRGQLQLAAALDVDLEGAVDQDVVDACRP